MQIQGNQALVVVTGTFRDPSVGQCATNSDPNAGLDPSHSFSANYSAALNGSNSLANGEFASPCMVIDGAWYVEFTL